MTSIDDLALLRCYAESRSEAAFAEIVRRHLNLVYSAALRIVGHDVGLAEDVAQVVFCDLARRATTPCSTVRQMKSLSGWLYQNACFAASKAVRKEKRRQFREQEAHAMRELNYPSAADADWNQLRPVIDAAMLELGDADREVVLLRYFDGRKLGEIGARLGLSENAARMRIERALERLGDRLKRRGVTLATSVLALFLTQQSIIVAPTGLAASITAASLAGAASTVLPATSTLQIIMASTKAKIALAVLLAASVTTPIVPQQQKTSRLVEELASFRQQGPELDRLRLEVHRLAAAAQSSAEQGERDRTELARLRGELAATKPRESKTVGAAKSTKAAKSATQADTSEAAMGALVQRDEWRNVGFQAPSSTVQTLEWAKANGDTNVIANALAWADEHSRAGEAEIFAAAPESVRARYGSADEYVLSLFNHSGPMDDRHTLTSYRILTENVTEDEAILELEYHYADGSTPRGPQRYVRIGNEWRQALDFDAPEQGKISSSLQAEATASTNPSEGNQPAGK